MNVIENALISVGGDVVHHFCGGVYAKETHIPAGTELGQHAHAWDHLSILAQGSVAVRKGIGVARFDAPAVIQIVAGVEHSVLALTDAVWLCVWREDAPDLKGE